MRLLLAALISAAVILPVRAGEGVLRVVATIPDLADIGREIGGDRVEIESLTKGTEDPHNVPIRPSHVSRLARANALLEVGLDFEHAFLPALVDAANNPKIKAGGRIVAGEGIVPREVPEVVTRKEGEQHLSGNPHVNLDPRSGRIFAKNIAAGLGAIAPAHKNLFEANLKKYLAKLDEKEKEWQAALEQTRGLKFVSYHADWVYWADYFEMTPIGTIERKPGIPPSGSHVAALIEKMKAENVKLVIREPHFSEQVPNEIAGKTGAKVLKLAIMAGGTPETRTWIGLIDSNLKAMLAAAGK